LRYAPAWFAALLGVGQQLKQGAGCGINLSQPSAKCNETRHDFEGMRGELKMKTVASSWDGTRVSRLDKESATFNYNFLQPGHWDRLLASPVPMLLQTVQLLRHCASALQHASLRGLHAAGLVHLGDGLPACTSMGP